MELAKAKNLSDETIATLNKLYLVLHTVTKNPAERSSDPKVVVSMIEGIEYTLQLLWGFPMDRNFHKYWYKINGCTCPKLDNMDVYGTEYRYLNKECPFHGG